ncbi:hypothetical protein BX661DRAFT_183821 [Kickxella alabastrina]|uniref:uncharacterized protein n=1 Tax=Kickxella alabastrina TaxID=61397 RepID=UPI00221FA4B3|nr:uncharacterized protein BX661DRAFT_183821 [Kickxella alabastrina]KAI7826342.1 hypothetical protein BX661DRAFT_183821 [Kickxella alabastrina]
MELADAVENLTQKSARPCMRPKLTTQEACRSPRIRFGVVDQAAKDKLELQAEIIQIRDNIKNVKDKMAVAVNADPKVPALALNGSANTLVQSETPMDTSSADAALANQKCRRNRKIIQFNLYLARAMFLSKHMFELEDATVDGLRVAELYLLLDNNNGVDALDRYFFLTT